MCSTLILSQRCFLLVILKTFLQIFIICCIYINVQIISCKQTHLYTHPYTHTHPPTHTHTQTHPHTPTHRHTHTHSHKYVCVCVCLSEWVSVCVCVGVDLHTRTHTHTHAHTLNYQHVMYLHPSYIKSPKLSLPYDYTLVSKFSQFVLFELSD